MQVRETQAGKSISAYVVLNRKGVQVASVQAHYSNGGTVTVDVWNMGDATTKRTAEAMGYTFGEDDKISAEPKGKRQKALGQYAYTVAGFQSGRAGGGGYDKFTAALSGLIIDGHHLSNHCGERAKRPAGRLWQQSDAAKLGKRGFFLANWSGPRDAGDANASRYGREGVPDDASGYVDAYRAEGLKYLQALGYRVIQAI